MNPLLSVMALCKHTFVYASMMHNVLQEIKKKIDGVVPFVNISDQFRLPHMFKVPV
jgi:hypothetical protein